MAGKPKPTALKLLVGSKYANSNPKEPRPSRRLPTAPEHMTAAAREEWDRISLELYQIGILTGTDRGAMAAYCQAYGTWVYASEAMNKAAERDPVMKGFLVQTRAGNVIQNPLLGVMNKSRGDMLKAAAEMGMTPSSRSRIIAQVPEGEDDPAARYFE